MPSPSRIVLLGAAALMAISPMLVLRSATGPRPSVIDRVTADTLQDRLSTDDLARPVADSAQTERASVPAGVAPASIEPSAVTDTRPIEGRVIDGTGAPVSNVTVSLQRMDSRTRTRRPVSATPTATTDARGAFRMPPTASFGEIGVSTEGYVTVVGVPWPQADGLGDATVVAGQSSSYAGIVVDEAGVALPGALVAVRHDVAVLRKIFHGQERTLEESWSATSDAEGSFAIDGVGWLPGTKLEVSLAPFEGEGIELGHGVYGDLEVVLRPARGGEGKLFGIVRRSDGGPAAGARITYAGGAIVECAPDGRFVVDLGEDPVPGRLIGALAGHMPAQLRIADPRRTCEASRLAPVVLEFDASALTIAGEVVEADGTPIAEAWVWTEDGTPFSGSRTLEDFCALDPESPGVGRRAAANAQGSFELTGLLDADYDLHAVHPRTFQVTAVAGVSAGSGNVRMVFDGASGGARVAGRVLYRDGTPAPGVRLYPMMAKRQQEGTGRPPFLVHSGQTTDAEGRFGFDSLHVQRLTLWVTGTEIGEPAETIRFDLERCDDPESIEIRVPHVVRFEVVLRGDPDEADSFRVLDADGQPLSLQYTLRGAQQAISSTGPRMKLSAGRSEVISCSQDARTLVLLRAGAEVRREAVNLSVGGVAVLEL